MNVEAFHSGGGFVAVSMDGLGRPFCCRAGKMPHARNAGVKGGHLLAMWTRRQRRDPLPQSEFPLSFRRATADCVSPSVLAGHGERMGRSAGNDQTDIISQTGRRLT